MFSVYVLAMRTADNNIISPVIIKEAAAWLSRMQEKPLSEAEWQALDIWRSQSSQHQDAWKKAELLAQKLGGVPSGLGLAILDRPQSADRRKFIRHLAVLAVAVPTTLLGYRQASLRGWGADIQTAKGELKPIRLADGSKLTVNTGSAVDVVFNEHQRLIKLYQGEIHIKTAHDVQGRPFFVETQHGRLRAMGTEFVVRRQEADSFLGVVESAVEVLPHRNVASERIVVKAGRQITFTEADASTQGVLDDNATSWMDGVLYADNMPLSQFISILSRYRTGVLRCDASSADILVSGAFQLKNPDMVLDVLQQTRPVRIEWHTRYWGVIYKAA